MTRLLILLATYLFTWTAPALAEQAVFYWECIGCDPYVGTVDEAVDNNPHLSKDAKSKLKDRIKKSVVDVVRLKKYVNESSLTSQEKERILQVTQHRSFVPWQLLVDRVPAELLSKIKAEERVEVTYEIGEIKKGEEISSMVFGKGERKSKVVARPKSGEPIKVLVYKVEEQGVTYITKLPLICNNLAFSTYYLPITGTGKKREPSYVIPMPVAQIGTIGRDHTMRIRAWDSRSVKPGSSMEEVIRSMAAEQGRQSRDLGARIREAARAKEIGPLGTCATFKVELRGIAFDAARGSTLFVNGIQRRVPENFGSEQNVLDVEVCGGEGSVAIPENWVLPSSIAVIHSPWRRPDLHYPPSGRLQTSGTAQQAKTWCDKEDPASGSELFKLARNCNASNFHFVK